MQQAGEVRGEPGDGAPFAGDGDSVIVERPEDLECGLPPADQPRRLNTDELNFAVRDVLGDTTRPFATVSNDFGETVGKYMTTGPRFVEKYLDVAFEVGERYAARVLDACNESDIACIGNRLRSTARLLFRGDVSDAQMTQLRDKITVAHDLGFSASEGIAAAVSTALMSPDFLIVQAAAGSEPGMYALGDFAIAERLALTLWRSVPDEQLLEAAANGRLGDPEGILAEAERMLSDPEKGGRFLEGFVGRKFSFPTSSSVPTGLEGVQDAGALADDLGEEARAYLRDLFTHDRGVSAFVQNESTFLNARLAEYYGIGGVSEEGFIEVSTAGTVRTGGLLTMGATLTRYGDLIHRGLNVLDLYTCINFEPVDSSVIEEALEALPEDPTVRDEIALRTENGACAGCHRMIDPLGAAFERFDADGSVRETYGNGESVEHEGLNFLGTEIRTPNDVSETVQEGDYASCLTKHVLDWVSNRRLEFADSRVSCANESVLADLGPDPGLRSIVMKALVSNLFTSRVVAEEGQ